MSRTCSPSWNELPSFTVRVASLEVARCRQEPGGDEPRERHERADRERGRQAPVVGDRAERGDAEAASADGEADDEPRGHPRVAGQVRLAEYDRHGKTRR